MSEEARAEDGGESRRDAPPRRRRRWRAIVLVAVLGFVVGAVVLVALGPTILSTNWGRGVAERAAGGGIPGSVRIESLALSWFGGQRAGGVELLDPEGERVLHIGGASTELGLWSALWGRMAMGHTVLHGVVGDIYVDEEGVSNLQRALGEDENDEPAEEPGVPASLSVVAELVDARVTFRGPGVGEPVVLEIGGAQSGGEGADMAAEAATPDGAAPGVRLSLASVTAPLELSLHGRAGQGDHWGAFEAAGRLEDVFDGTGRLRMDRLRVEELIAELSEIPTVVVDRLAGQDGLLPEALGERVTAQLTGSGGTDDEAMRGEVVVSLIGDRLEARDWRFVLGDALELADGGEGEWFLTPMVAGRVLLGEEEDSIALREGVATSLRVERLRVGFGGEGDPAFDPRRVQLAARWLANERVRLVNVPEAGEAWADDLLVELGGESLAAFEAVITAQAGEEQPGVVTEAAGDGPVALRVEADGAWTDEGVKYSAVLLEAEGERLYARVSGALDEGGLLELREPGEARLLVTPALVGMIEGRFAEPGEAELAAAGAGPAAQSNPAGGLAGMLREAVQVEVALNQLRASTGLNQSEAEFDLADLLAGAAVRLGDVELADEAGDLMSVMRGAMVEASYDGPGGSVGVTVDARVFAGGAAVAGLPDATRPAGAADALGRRRDAVLAQAEGDAPEEQEQAEADEAGVVRLEMLLEDFLREGELGFEAARVGLAGRMDRFPVALLDAYLGGEGLYGAALGEEVGLAVEANVAEMRGELNLDARSPYAAARIAGLIEEGVLHLREPLVAEAVVTERLGQMVLARINPVLQTAYTAESPIRLEVAADGFAVPLVDFDIARAVVPEARLEMGRISLRPGGVLDGALRLAQRFGRLDGVAGREMVAWFTPAVFEVRDGRVEYERRVDLLVADTLHLASWGSVDLGEESVSIVLAVMPRTLERVFRLEGVGDSVFQLPVTGTWFEPRVDFARAAADMGRLQAMGRLRGRERLLGDLLGGGAEALLGAREAAMPGPSVEPLPWADLGPEEPEPPEEAEEPDEPDVRERLERELERRLEDLF